MLPGTGQPVFRSRHTATIAVFAISSSVWRSDGQLQETQMRFLVQLPVYYNHENVDTMEAL